MSLSFHRIRRRSDPHFHDFTQQIASHRRKQVAPSRAVSYYDTDDDDTIPTTELASVKVSSAAGAAFFPTTIMSTPSTSPSPSLSFSFRPSLQFERRRGMIHVASSPALFSSPFTSPSLTPTSQSRLFHSSSPFQPSQFHDQDMDDHHHDHDHTSHPYTPSPPSSPISTSDMSLSLTRSSPYSNRSSLSPSPSPQPRIFTSNSSSPQPHSHPMRSSSSNQLSALGKRKVCGSCGTKNTPYWRDGWNGICLCNACGIRYKKRRLACSHCFYVPRKDERGEGNCSKCNQGVFQAL